ncbi:MAG: glycosyltransferase family 4 protein [Bacteroidota bacterium]|jgi:glycosyltransferase involved in cell wall biosynthesis
MKNHTRTRICHFASVHTTDDTRVFHRECVSMARYFDVHLIAIGKQSGLIHGVHVTAVPTPKTRLHRLLFTTWVVFLKALRVNARIYHIHDAELLPFGILLSLLGKKVIYDIHENTYEDIRHKPWIPRYIKFFASRIYRFTEWVASWYMHFILVIAKPELASCFRTRRFSIIQNYADITELKPYRVNKRSALNDNTLFYMGTVHDMYYNFNTVVEAIALLKKRGTRIHLKVAGFSRKYEQFDLPLLRAYDSVKNQIQFLGYQSPEDAYKHSMSCKLALCLKNQPAPILVSHERKFFEYMALGMPFICCDSHIYTDVLKKYKAGIAIDLSNASALADTIVFALSHPDKLDSMQNEGIRAAESEYNWESQQRILAELYTSMIH